jgi:hypothetical protein
MRACGWLTPLLVAACVLGCREPARETAPAIARDQASLLARANALAPCAPASTRRADVPELLLVPHEVRGYCLDPNAEVLSVERQVPRIGFPRETTSELADACARRLGPLCSSYLEGGLERLVAFRYVGGAAGSGALDVLFARFASSEGSFGLFGDQVLGDKDPSALQIDALDAAGTAVRMGSAALGWRGPYVVRLSYANAEETAAERDASANALFRDVLEHAGRVLPEHVPAAAAALPRAVQSLPMSGRVPFGVRYETGDVLGVVGVRGAAEGYYRANGKRWRVLAIQRPDPEGAEDVLRAFARHPDGHEVRYAPLRGLRFTERRPSGEPTLDWVIGQKGAIVYGVGDDPAALPAGVSAVEEMEVKLTLWQKLDKLMEVARLDAEARGVAGTDLGGAP